jgi:hypothetical protein
VVGKPLTEDEIRERGLDGFTIVLLARRAGRALEGSAGLTERLGLDEDV